MHHKVNTTNIEGMQDHVLSRVELSYNYLKSEEAKSIFLLCSCFPEDFQIPVEVLARYGMGLMCFQNIDSMEKARGRARSLVSSLIFTFLLIDGDKEGYVKMHDVVRDAAQQIASKNDYMIRARVGLKDWPSIDTCKVLKGISLMYNDFQEIPNGLEMECPNLQALLLQGNVGFKIPNYFFQGIKDLKVLDMSYNNFSSLPSSLSFLSNLRTLYLCRCKFHDDLSLIGELIRLEILDLSGSNIVEIPISFGQLSHLRLLDLTYCGNLTIIPRGVISRLYKLEELYMSSSFSLWDSESEGDSRSNNARLIELQTLSRLTSLHIVLPQGVILPPDMPSVNLTSFSISTGYSVSLLIDGFFEKFHKRCSRVLILSHDMMIPVLHAWIKNLIIRSEILVLDNINSVENLFVDQVNEGFSELKYLVITGCGEMKYFFNTLERTPRVTFLKLEWLIIFSNSNFLGICHDQLPSGYFGNVKSLNVLYCDKVLNILSSHLLKSFQNLEYFSAIDCHSMVYVFGFEGLEIAKEEPELCSSLKELELQYLPRLTHIWKGDAQLASLHNLKSVQLFGCTELRVLFPATLVESLVHLKDVSVEDCSKLEEIFGRKAGEDRENEWKRREQIHAAPSLALENLVSVRIVFCSELQSLFTTSMVKSLVRLQSLVVYSCPKLKEIITATDEEEEAVGTSTKKITFPCLLGIHLWGLDSLSCFCSGLYDIEFPALEHLSVSECPSMETFGYGEVQLKTPKPMSLCISHNDVYLRFNKKNHRIHDEQ